MNTTLGVGAPLNDAAADDAVIDGAVSASSSVEAPHVETFEAAEPSTVVYGLASRLRCTEGQVYTMAIGLTAATILALAGGVPLGAAPRPVALPLQVAPSQSPAPGVVGVPDAGPTTGPVAPVPALPLGGLATHVPPTPAGQPQPAPVSTEQLVGPTTQYPALVDIPAPGFPRAMASDANGLYVGTDNSSGASQLLVYSPSGHLTRRITMTGQAPSRTGGLSAAAVRGDSVLVTDRSRGALVQVDPRTGHQRLLATIPDLPACIIGITGTCQPGAQDLPPSPEGVAVAGNYAYIADAGQGTIWRYDVTANKLAAWYSSSDFTLGGPSGLAIDAAGDLLFTVATSGDTAALDKGALYRLGVGADGTAGTRTLVASWASSDDVGPVAVGRAGDLYVGLRGTGGVAVVSRTGVVTTLAGAGASQVPTPAGLDLVDGHLVVADEGHPASSTSGRLVTVAVSDGPVS